MPTDWQIAFIARYWILFSVLFVSSESIEERKPRLTLVGATPQICIPMMNDSQEEEVYCHLFVYGVLQPGLKPPKTMRRFWSDRMCGELYDLGWCPGATRIGRTTNSFSGFTIEIAYSELIAVLDTFEETDEGVYRRIRSRTESGKSVWVYEYMDTMPKNAVGPIDAWFRHTTIK